MYNIIANNELILKKGIIDGNSFTTSIHSKATLKRVLLKFDMGENFSLVDFRKKDIGQKLVKYRTELSLVNNQTQKVESYKALRYFEDDYSNLMIELGEKESFA